MRMRVLLTALLALILVISSVSAAVPTEHPRLLLTPASRLTELRARACYNDDGTTIDGCSPIQVFRHIALPLAVPGIIATGIFIFLVACDIGSPDRSGESPRGAPHPASPSDRPPLHPGPIGWLPSQRREHPCRAVCSGSSGPPSACPPGAPGGESPCASIRWKGPVETAQ